MVMVAGRKKWTLFHPDDLPLLSPRWHVGRLAPTFPALAELRANVDGKHPHFERARQIEVVLSPGDVLFVPGGTPHHVENLDNTISYAGNFVDAANVDRVLKDMAVLGATDAGAAAGHIAIDQVDFDRTAGAHHELLQPASLVVRYDDVTGGAVSAWEPTPPEQAAFVGAALEAYCDPRQLWLPSPAAAGAYGAEGADEGSGSRRGARRETQLLEDAGYVVLRRTLPEAQALELRSGLQTRLLLALDAASSGGLEPGQPKSPFAKINTRAHRYDLRLRLDPDVRAAVTAIVSAYSEVYRAMLPDDASLVELGVISSYPGSEQQAIHSDVTYDADAREVFTTFVALQPITPQMGPTEIWPGTHSGVFCLLRKPTMLGPVDRYYSDNPPDRMAVDLGDAVLMDTRVMHCGGANESDSLRMLFHFSFESTAEPNAPAGFTYNLMPELQGKVMLSDFLR
jgi:hypothetical protein